MTFSLIDDFFLIWLTDPCTRYALGTITILHFPFTIFYCPTAACEARLHERDLIMWQSRVKNSEWKIKPQVSIQADTITQNHLTCRYAPSSSEILNQYFDLPMNIDFMSSKANFCNKYLRTLITNKKLFIHIFWR